MNGEDQRSALPAAAIDLGTETALLVIGRRAPDGSLEILEDHCLATRLGAGLGAGSTADGQLDSRAVERTLDVLETFARRIQLAGVPAERVRAAGTAALRAASDAQGFLSAAIERCGLRFEVLAPEREAELAFEAVRADGAGPDVLVVDVGGGSTEVIWGAGRRRQSVELGAVTATDRWLGGAEREGPIDPQAWSAFRSAAADLARGLPEGVAEGAEVVLLGGTASNLACMDRELESYEPRRRRIGASTPRLPDGGEPAWPGKRSRSAWTTRSSQAEPESSLGGWVAWRRSWGAWGPPGAGSAAGDCATGCSERRWGCRRPGLASPGRRARGSETFPFDASQPSAGYLTREGRPEPSGWREPGRRLRPS